MSNDDFGYFLAILLSIALLLTMRSCAVAEHEGMCAERWHYQVTAADTLKTIRGGCELP